MRGTYRALQVLVWLTQAGLSIVIPPLLFIGGAAWLKARFSLGDWVTVVGIVLGVLGVIGGLINTFRTLDRIGHAPEDEPPRGFNDHD